MCVFVFCHGRDLKSPPHLPPSPLLSLPRPLLAISLLAQTFTALPPAGSEKEHAPQLGAAAVEHLRIVNETTLLVVAADNATDTNTAMETDDMPDEQAQGGFTVMTRGADDAWTSSATFLPTGTITAVDVLTRSERRHCDPEPVILLGYSNGRCELREIATLGTTNLDHFIFSPYFPRPTVVQQLKDVEVVGEAGEADTVDADRAGDDTQQAAAELPDAKSEEEVVDTALPRASASLAPAAEASGSDGLPILSFAVSPNCVEILVAKRGAAGSTVVDLFRYDCDKLEGVFRLVGAWIMCDGLNLIFRVISRRIVRYRPRLYCPLHGDKICASANQRPRIHRPFCAKSLCPARGEHHAHSAWVLRRHVCAGRVPIRHHHRRRSPTTPTTTTMGRRPAPQPPTRTPPLSRARQRRTGL